MQMDKEDKGVILEKSATKDESMLNGVPEDSLNRDDALSNDATFTRVLDRPLLEMAGVLEGMAEGIREIPQYMRWDGVTEHAVYESAYASVMCDTLISSMKNTNAKEQGLEQRMTTQVKESILTPFLQLSATLEEISKSLFNGWHRKQSKRRYILNGEKYQALHCTPNSVRELGSKVYVSPKDIGEVMPDFMKSFKELALFRFSVVVILALLVMTNCIPKVFEYFKPYVISAHANGMQDETSSSGETSSEVEPVGIESFEDLPLVSIRSDSEFIADFGEACYGMLEMSALCITHLVWIFMAVSLMLDMVYFAFPVFREAVNRYPERLRFVSTLAYDVVKSKYTPEMDYIWISKIRFARCVAEQLHKVNPEYQVPEAFLTQLETQGFRTLEDFRKAASIEVLADCYNMGLLSDAVF